MPRSNCSPAGFLDLPSGWWLACRHVAAAAIPRSHRRSDARCMPAREVLPCRVVLDPQSLHGAFIREIEAISEQNLLECNQCGRCSAGCPLVEEMDLLPSQVLRFLQLGLETPLMARTPWVCAACLMCEFALPEGC